MCGLTGVLLHPGRRSAATWQAIREVVRASLVFSEERGRDASGLAVVDRRGGLRLVKQAIPSSELVTSAAFEEVLAAIGPGATCVLGHTRRPTKGCPSNSANNHPIPAGPVIGIHNGEISNDDALFARLGLPRSGEVDSEIIFRLLAARPGPLGGAATLPELRARVLRLRGTFATISVDRRAPHRLVVLKKLRPLCLHYEESHRCLYFSSRYIFLRKSFGRSVITEAIDGDRGYVFNGRDLPATRACPALSFTIPDAGAVQADDPDRRACADAGRLAMCEAGEPSGCGRREEASTCR
jgi:glucosamine 6-phosphate synthetase-like amidotransferase/phosphosugar isomerase protein